MGECDMGNRVRITLTEDGERFTPSLYLHWGGSSALELCQKACNHMASRGADASYALARLTALACEAFPGTVSVGILDGPADLAEAKSDDYSHGDAGVWVVTLTGSEWRIECFNGREVEGALTEPRTLTPETVAK